MLTKKNMYLFILNENDDLKFRILQNISYFTSTWLKSEFLSFVFVSVAAFEIFTGEKIFAYLHHYRGNKIALVQDILTRSYYQLIYFTKYMKMCRIFKFVFCLVDKWITIS